MTIDLRNQVIDYDLMNTIEYPHSWLPYNNGEMQDFYKLLNSREYDYYDEVTVVVKTKSFNPDNYPQDVQVISEIDFWKTAYWILYPERLKNINTCYYRIKPEPWFEKSDDCYMSFSCVHTRLNDISVFISDGMYGSTDPNDFIIEKKSVNLSDCIIVWRWHHDGGIENSYPLAFNNQEDLDEYFEFHGNDGHLEQFITQKLCQR